MSYRSPGPELSERGIHSVRRARAWLSLANLPIKHRLPLLIGILLLGIFVMSTLASYREVRESSLEIGRERLRNLTQQFASISQQSSFSSLNKLVTAANDPVVGAFLRSPSPATKDRAVALLQQFGPGQDPSNLQVELWNANHTPALTIPEGSSPEPPSLEAEFKQCSSDPYKALGALRIVNDTVVVPSAVAVRDDSGTLNGYLVKWRKVSVNPPPQQLTDLLGNHAVLYFGNTQGDFWTDLTRVVPQPPVSMNPSAQVTHYVRDGNSVMALGQVIDGTPWSVVIEISDQVFVSHAGRFLRRMAIIGVALLALGLAGAILLSRNITQPLRALTEAASAISSGDYSRTVDIRRDDELGALANTFNSMVISTRDSQRELERKVQEQTLQLEAAPWAMLMVNQEGRVTLVNMQAEKLFGYGRSELLEQPIEMLVPERYRSAHPGHRRIFSQHPTARAMGAGRDLYGLRKDGGEVPIEIGLNPITTDKGEFVLASIVDITERKRSDEALKEQACILDLAPVVIRDLNGRIVFWNTGAEQMYGWKSEEALGKIAHSLKETEFPLPIEEIRARLYAHNHWEGEVVHTRKDGKRIVVASRWVLHRDEHDQPKGILEVNNDVTERKQAEREILRLNEELEQHVADRTAQLEAANKELEAFSYSVSHDLRAPLRHIDGFSQALLEDYSDKLDKEGKNFLQEVRSASQEMAQLIDDMLQLARITRSEMRREEVNLSELATDVIAELRKTEGRRGVTVNIEEGVSRQGDKRLLRIVLMNLLGNSWKFTGKRKRAEITFGQAGKNGETYCFVRDNGAGFDMTYGNKLFGAFQRLHSTGEFEGTGIGLATVQRIINRHGGRVWAEGVVNEGAAFYFILPNFKETGTGEPSLHNFKETGTGELSLHNFKETGNGEHSDLAG